MFVVWHDEGKVKHFRESLNRKLPRAQAPSGRDLGSEQPTHFHLI